MKITSNKKNHIFESHIIYYYRELIVTNEPTNLDYIMQNKEA
jgi:hypothetical protein